MKNKEQEITSENLMGFSIYNGDVYRCAEEMYNEIQYHDSKCKLLSCINPHSYVMAQNHEIFRKSLISSQWVIPDGIGITIASRLNGGQIRHRITGFDIFWTLTSRMNQSGGGRVFFLGSTDEVLNQIKDRLKKDFPTITVVGIYSPPFTDNFSDKDDQKMIEAINRAKPDVLWVGMTAPKQERWMYENQKQLNVPVAAAIGAVFDFYAGTVKRSSPLFRSLGLEWLTRLIQQPARLWRRTFVSAPVFIFCTMKYLMKKK